MADALVLAGPMLRRCTANEATVWIALRQAKRVTLRVYAVTNTAPPTATPNFVVGSAAVLTGSADTVQVGASVHVVVVQATTSAPLALGQLYVYQLYFGTHATAGDLPETATKLDGADIIQGGIGSIAYAPLPLPSYALFPQEVGGLRILHGSCRKAHGEGTDALPAAELVVRDSAFDLGTRPHLLLMTGDQIYADDVADALLDHIVSKLSEYVWLETLPDPAPNSEELMPGARTGIAKRTGLTAGSVSKSHLMRFGEFLLMYLMAWSPTLWPQELRKFAQVFPKLQAELERISAQLSNPPRDRSEKTRLELQRAAILHRKEQFEAECASLRSFASGLEAVRRLLANVPTLMMMDDHEITDDWYLHFGWCKSVLGSRLGPRIIQNGMAAFAVCQAWGNTPERFQEGQPGAQVLSLLKQWANAKGDPPAALQNVLGIPTASHVQATRTVRAPGLRWHCRFSGPEFEILLLDSRTSRAFPAGAKVADDDPAQLISREALNEQIADVPPNPNAKLLIVTAATPVYSETLFDALQRIDVLSATFFDKESWALRFGQIEILQAMITSRCRRVVILSGDVPYGYSARTRVRALQDSVIVQLNSSPFRNEDWKTRALHGVGYVVGCDRLPTSFEWLGWSGPGPVTLRVRVAHKDYRCKVSKLPSMGKRVQGEMEIVGATPQPSWRSRTDYLLATNLGATPETRVDSLPAGAVESLEQLRRHAENYEDYAEEYGNGKEILGVNHFGVISFRNWTADVNAVPSVRHELWWRLKVETAQGEVDGEAFPFTQFDIPLDLRQEWDTLENA